MCQAQPRTAPPHELFQILSFLHNEIANGVAPHNLVAVSSPADSALSVTTKRLWLVRWHAITTTRHVRSFTHLIYVVGHARTHPQRVRPQVIRNGQSLYSQARTRVCHGADRAIHVQRQILRLHGRATQRHRHGDSTAVAHSQAKEGAARVKGRRSDAIAVNQPRICNETRRHRARIWLRNCTETRKKATHNNVNVTHRIQCKHVTLN